MSDHHVGRLEEAVSVRRLRCDGCDLWYDPGVEWEVEAWWDRVDGRIYGSKYCPTCATILRSCDDPDKYRHDIGDLPSNDPDWEHIRIKHGYPMGDEDE